jgi:hypothetical protein
MNAVFVNKRKAAELTGFSSHTLKKLRISGDLIEGVHWVKHNPRVVLYNAALLVDWVQNRHDLHVHQRAIETFQRSLLSNQRKQRLSA